MNRASKALELAVAVTIGGSAIACSAPPSQKTTLVVCEAGENGCPSDEPKSSKQTSKKTSEKGSGPSGTPAPAASPPDEETPPKADPDAGAEPGPGPICTALKACCDELKAAGYSDAMCLEIVDTKSESACSLQHKQYRDFGDCS